MDFTWSTTAARTEAEFYSADGEPDLCELFTGSWRNPFLIIDAAVARLWDSRLQPLMLVSSGVHLMDADEVLKNTFTLSRIWESMFDSGIRRDTPVAVVGGGLVCDMGAMAASTYMRGLRLMLLPTTLLCMVDACLGGKTGVNMAGAKNQIGTFYPAERIAVLTSFLTTLPRREYGSGLAEAVKTALIGGTALRDSVRDAIRRDDGNGLILEVVRECLEVKGGIVEGDLRERGGRMILNLGHTVGHALESESGFGLSHGEAVGLGMIAEAEIAVLLGGSKNLPGEIRELLADAGLPTTLDGEFPERELEELLDRDKKTRREGRTWALPFDWGDCRLVQLSREDEERMLPAAMGRLKA